jgi:Transcriptional regulator SbtR-like, C-terminal domain
VLQREMDAYADAAADLSASNEPGAALTNWLHPYSEILAMKPALATALHSGDPAFDELPGYFWQRFGPALASLLEAATASSEIRDDINAKDLLLRHRQSVRTCRR